MDERLVRAKEWHERAVFGGEEGALTRGHSELDSVEADLALARGRLIHAQYLAERNAYPPDHFERAVELYSRVGDTRGEAEALFCLGTYHQVVHGDHDTALPHFERSRDLALAVDDKLVLSYAVRHLGFVEMERENLAAAREFLEQSVALRREVGFLPGVAAGLLALAELAKAEGDQAESRALLDEAAATADASGAKGHRPMDRLGARHADMRGPSLRSCWCGPMSGSRRAGNRGAARLRRARGQTCTARHGVRYGHCGAAPAVAARGRPEPDLPGGPLHDGDAW